MTRFAVTAASGRFGHEVVRGLLDRGVSSGDVVALARTPAKATDLAGLGVEVRDGDYERPEDLVRSLVDVDRLLLVSGMDFGRRVQQHTNVIEAAQESGVQRILYTSFLNAGHTTHPRAPEHEATESVLRDSGVSFTLLRNGYYFENYLGRVPAQLASGEVVGAAGDGRVSGAARADYAAAATTALLEDIDGDVAYELGGVAHSYADYAATLSDLSGSTVTYRNLTPEEYHPWLLHQGTDPETAAYKVSHDVAVSASALETASTDLARLAGRPLTPFGKVLRATLDS